MKALLISLSLLTGLQASEYAKYEDELQSIFAASKLLNQDKDLYLRYSFDKTTRHNNGSRDDIRNSGNIETLTPLNGLPGLSRYFSSFRYHDPDKVLTVESVITYDNKLWKVFELNAFTENKKEFPQRLNRLTIEDSGYLPIPMTIRSEVYRNPPNFTLANIGKSNFLSSSFIKNLSAQNMKSILEAEDVSMTMEGDLLKIIKVNKGEGTTEELHLDKRFNFQPVLYTNISIPTVSGPGPWKKIVVTDCVFVAGYGWIPKEIKMNSDTGSFNRSSTISLSDAKIVDHKEADALIPIPSLKPGWEVIDKVTDTSFFVAESPDEVSDKIEDHFSK